MPSGFSAVKPPTPAEVAEAEKAFQLAVRTPPNRSLYLYRCRTSALVSAISLEV